MDKRSIAKAAGISAAVLAGAATGLTPLSPAFSDEEEIWVGVQYPDLLITSSWYHSGSESTYGTNLDLQNADDPTNGTAGLGVQWFSRHVSGDWGVFVTPINYTGNCTGVRLNVQNGITFQNIGDYWYVHIAPAQLPVNWKTSSNPGGAYQQNIGTILETETTNCINAGGWTGSHLHQGGATFGTNLSLNSSLDADVNDVIHISDWMHRWVY